VDLVLEAPLQDLRNLLFAIFSSHVANTWGEVQHTPLWQRSLGQHLDVSFRVADSLEPTGDAESVEEAGDGLVNVRAEFRIGDLEDCRVEWGEVEEGGENGAVAVGRRGSGELEDCV